jgi:hypothetical protein
MDAQIVAVRPSLAAKDMLARLYKKVLAIWLHLASADTRPAASVLPYV